jgi:hypothetical protein
MKIKNKGLMIAALSLIAMAFLLPVYAQYQSGVMQQDRDQDCTPQGPATRAYGEEPPIQAYEDKVEDLSKEAIEDGETPTQEQTQTRERLRDCNCENEDCEAYQYQYQYQRRCGQEED